jgi:uncharacterized SAM-binding protein YcdF (DUF218 family)
LNPKWKKRSRWLLALLLLGLAGFTLVAAWVGAPVVLLVDTSFTPARAEDLRSAGALVVLGGEPWTRPERAAEVWRETRAARVIVSGEGDCQDVRRQLEARGVPSEIIQMECKSTSTYENAQFSVRLLRAQHITNAVIVTSWYHSRRALACFKRAAPEMHFQSRPTSSTTAFWPDRYERKRILQEYAKLAYYWAVHGVPPWN